MVELLAIDFGDQPNGIGATLQVNICAAPIVGAIIATSNPVALPDDFGGATMSFRTGGGVTHFDFAASAPLVAGSLYVIEPHHFRTRRSGGLVVSGRAGSAL